MQKKVISFFFSKSMYDLKMHACILKVTPFKNHASQKMFRKIQKIYLLDMCSVLTHM